MTTDRDLVDALDDTVAALNASLSSDADHVAALHERLAAAADAAQLVDVAYRTIDTPLGPLLLATTDIGLVRVAFEREGHDAVLAALATNVSPRILRHAKRLDAVARQLDEYFAGQRRRFDLDLDRRLSSGFRDEVLRQLPTIEYGRTASYADIARLAGRPAAVRAVGSACANNPHPIVVPCHRVVRSDGRRGEYLGGAAAKEALLELEAAA